MMNRTGQYIRLVFFLITVMGWGLNLVAEEAIVTGIPPRPVMEYKSDKLRDPFKRYLVKEAPKEVVPGEVVIIKPKLDLTKLKVQGIIWGGRIPQAIINNKVLTIDDLIEGAKITNIEQKGITVCFDGVIYNLAAPGQNAVQAAVK